MNIFVKVLLSIVAAVIMSGIIIYGSILVFGEFHLAVLILCAFGSLFAVGPILDIE